MGGDGNYYKRILLDSEKKLKNKYLKLKKRNLELKKRKLELKIELKKKNKVYLRKQFIYKLKIK